MRAFVVLGLVFSIPNQEIGLGKRLRKWPILCRVGRQTQTSTQSINQTSDLHVFALYTGHDHSLPGIEVMGQRMTRVWQRCGLVSYYCGRLFWLWQMERSTVSVSVKTHTAGICWLTRCGRDAWSPRRKMIRSFEISPFRMFSLSTHSCAGFRFFVLHWCRNCLWSARLL